MDYFEKLKKLPCEVVKESGRLTGNYALRISISGGTWFLEYVYDGEWLEFPLSDNSIEYTRTDTFIEKACDWLKNHNDYIDVKDGNVTYFDMEKCVEDFRKAMKGGDE